MAIEGNLQDMSLPDIIQLNCRNKEQARVSLINEQQSGEIYFSAGQITHAVFGQEHGETAIYQLLGWEKGQFIIEKNMSSPEQTIETPWAALILQGLQRLDEKRVSADDEISEKEVTNEESPVMDILQELAGSLDDFVAALVVDADGAALARLVADATFDAPKAIATLGRVLKQANDTSAAMEAGSFSETITSTTSYLFITRPMGQGKFFVQLVLGADGNIGAARVYLTEHEEDLIKHILT